MSRRRGKLVSGEIMMDKRFAMRGSIDLTGKCKMQEKRPAPYFDIHIDMP
jgi:hypothetical protein